MRAWLNERRMIESLRIWQKQVMHKNPGSNGDSGVSFVNSLKDNSIQCRKKSGKFYHQFQKFFKTQEVLFEGIFSL